jgi:hypothetical protein
MGFLFQVALEAPPALGVLLSWGSQSSSKSLSLTWDTHVAKLESVCPLDEGIRCQING